MTELKPKYDDMYYEIVNNCTIMDIMAKFQDIKLSSRKARTMIYEELKRMGYRPQSLTEKVKLEPLDEYLLKDFMLDYECKLNGSVLCNDEYMDYVRGLAKSICQRFGKQSLNQASQEDRDEIAKVAYSGYFGCGKVAEEYWPKEFKAWNMVADAILKAYVLVRKNEER